MTRIRPNHPNTVNDYVYANGLFIAKLNGNNVCYFHQDHLGNTRLVTLGSTTSFSSNYQPYGVAYEASGVDPVYKYTGKPQTGTGLYYYGARWYNASLPVTDWWNSQDQSTRLAIVAVVATVAIVATAGLAAPALVPLIATGIAIGAGSSAASYVATNVAAGKPILLSGLAKSVAIGGFFGAVSFGTYGVVAGAASAAGLGGLSSFIIGAAAFFAVSKVAGSLLGTSGSSNIPDFSPNVNGMLTNFRTNTSSACQGATGPGGIVTDLLVGGALTLHLGGLVHWAGEGDETIEEVGIGISVLGVGMIAGGVAMGHALCP